jgi:uncharacterized protein (DUF2461 family)
VIGPDSSARVIGTEMTGPAICSAICLVCGATLGPLSPTLKCYSSSLSRLSRRFRNAGTVRAARGTTAKARDPRAMYSAPRGLTRLGLWSMVGNIKKASFATLSVAGKSLDTNRSMPVLTALSQSNVLIVARMLTRAQSIACQRCLPSRRG